MWTNCSLSCWWVYYSLICATALVMVPSNTSKRTVSSAIHTNNNHAAIHHCSSVCICLIMSSSFLTSSYQGYRAEMEDPSMSYLLPSALRSQKDVLFGNMPEIYQFHSRQATHTHTFNSQAVTELSPIQFPFIFLLDYPFRIFLQDLQGCLETPERVGACFLRRVRKHEDKCEDLMWSNVT